jgi:arylsulfatase A-like enzyme
VLVSVDTLRADHLGCYGYPRRTTPFLDRLAAEGALFENAIAASATTGPSHASIFSGLHPLQHGVRSNHQQMHPGIPTLAELAQRAGYQTAAFVAVDTHFRPSGLDRGFEVWSQPRRTEEGGVRSAERTVSAAERWLEARDDARPVFLWIHLFDPHAPYSSPPFSSTPQESAAVLRQRLDGVDLSLFAGQESNWLRLIDAYDGEVAAVDRALSALFEVAERRYASAQRLWVVVGDHGEGLGNHGWLAHGRQLYNEQLRVPLLVHASDGSLAGRRIGAVVAHVDLLPTFLDLLRAPSRPAPAPWAGSSLLPLLTGGESGEARRAFSERRHFAPVEGPPRAPLRQEVPEPFSLEALLEESYKVGWEPGEKYALQSRRYKYIHHTLFPDELYDLERDPHELHDLAGTGLAVEEELRAELAARVAELERGASPERAVRGEAAEALRELGYVE